MNSDFFNKININEIRLVKWKSGVKFMSYKIERVWGILYINLTEIYMGVRKHHGVWFLYSCPFFYAVILQIRPHVSN